MTLTEQSQSGFSLIELVITLVIVIVLLGVGLPQFRTTLAGSERTSSTNELLSSLGLARSEAMKRGVNVSLCRGKQNSETECATAACDTSTHSNCWESGWVLFVDDNSSGTPGVRDSGEAIIRVTAFDRPQHLWSGTNYTDSITYLSSGAVTQAGMLSYCIDWNGDGDYTDAVDARNWRAVMVNLSGQPRLAVDDDSPKNGVVDDAGGNDLTCP